MSGDLASGRDGRHMVIPHILASAGEDAITRFAEYFTAHIRNANTRRAYFRNALAFLRWCEGRGICSLKDIRPMTVAAYVESLGQSHAKPTVKQHLATIRMLFDWLVTGQVVPTNPAHAVRGPKHVVTRGKTPVLVVEETRAILDGIGTASVVALRDRALIAAMFFTFARVGAVVTMAVEDYYPQGKRMWLRLQEKGGKVHEMPAHHTLEEFLDAYVAEAGIASDRRGPLFRTATRRGDALTTNPMLPADVWRMIRRRAAKAGIGTPIGCHSFRATGITNYLENAGTLEKAQQMAAHASPRTTKLYDRTDDRVTLDEVEKIRL
ncbi:tyrosine-type recombinase/integrase [Tautonia rosea]|uniref:tyrosine-type recombinase/integrase n=1 Tax=Tautonia rosea TaxID=2728037 RepID=UPI00147432AA|nr:tyrosine-type recombinase/integrase [Tautonia rosea]